VILADSSVWIAFFNDSPRSDVPEVDMLESLLEHDKLAVGDLILMEVLQGFRNDRSYRLARDLMASLPILTLSDPDIAIKSAENYRSLRKRGITVRRSIDTIIATFCIEHRFPLLHLDRDFAPFTSHLGLITVH
jgi:predicted nucleic acid-binding protein